MLFNLAFVKMLLSAICTSMKDINWRSLDSISSWQVDITLFCYKNICFLLEAEYSYFSANSRPLRHPTVSGKLSITEIRASTLVIVFGDLRNKTRS